MYSQLKALVIITLLGSGVSAHEQTPAYPKMKYSTVKYYKIALFDRNFAGLPFSTRHRIIKVNYQTRTNFDVYVRKRDLDEAMYICTISKTMKQRGSKPFVRSMVCSKIMEETK